MNEMTGQELVEEAAQRACDNHRSALADVRREFAWAAELIEAARVISRKLLSTTEPVTGIDATNLATALNAVEKIGESK